MSGTSPPAAVAEQAFDLAAYLPDAIFQTGERLKSCNEVHQLAQRRKTTTMNGYAKSAPADAVAVMRSLDAQVCTSYAPQM